MGIPLKVLIVEDSPDDAELLVLQLRRAGYDLEYQVVATEKELVGAIGATEWDLIISDYSLPGFGGLDALKIVRQREFDMPFIIVSGVIGEETAVEAMKAGAQDYMMKGNLIRLLPAIVRELSEAEVRRERKKTRQALKETERQLLTLLSNLPGMAYRCGNDEEWTMEFISDGCLEVTGYTPEEIIGNKKISFNRMMPPEDARSVHEKMNAAILAGKPYELIYRIVTASGQTKWLWEKGRAVFGPDNGVEALEGFISDITERKKFEQELEASLKEKVILLKEVHHRVKNNLQVIYSLLSLQSGYVKDPQALDMFKECRDRVKSMALIHEILYRSRDLAKVDFGDYVRTLVGNLTRSYQVQTGQVDIQVDVAQMRLELDVAIPCGLMINELVSNALKYAFPNGRKGLIEIVLQQPEEGIYNLKIRDNGIGFPESIDFRKTDTLGLQLVNTLSEQLDGKIELIREGGTQFVITFAISKKHEEESGS